MAEETEKDASANVAISGVWVQVDIPASKVKEAVTFYKAVFGAEEASTLCCPKSNDADKEQPSTNFLRYTELKIGTTSFLICGQPDDTPLVNKLVRYSPVLIRVEVDDAGTALDKAVKAGALFWSTVRVDNSTSGVGEKVGNLSDPFGVSWLVVSPLEAEGCFKFL